MVVRQLLDIEYIRLREVGQGYVPKPEGSVVVIAEDDKGICVRLMLLPILHLDGIWIREDLRNNPVGGRAALKVEKEMTRILEEADIKCVQVDVYRDDMEKFLGKLGYYKMDKIISVFRKEFSNGN